jgi:hypothetical protein
MLNILHLETALLIALDAVTDLQRENSQAIFSLCIRVVNVSIPAA